MSLKITTATRTTLPQRTQERTSRWRGVDLQDQWSKNRMVKLITNSILPRTGLLQPSTRTNRNSRRFWATMPPKRTFNKGNNMITMMHKWTSSEITQVKPLSPTTTMPPWSASHLFTKAKGMDTLARWICITPPRSTGVCCRRWIQMNRGKGAIRTTRTWHMWTCQATEPKMWEELA